jgi:hypothetical protein
MPEPPPEPNPVSARLHAVAQLLRQVEHLEPETQQALADLVDELGSALGPGTASSAELTHLTESTAGLIKALHGEEESGVLSKARDRLNEAIVRAEAGAPVAAGIARRLVETLSNIGI